VVRPPTTISLLRTKLLQTIRDILGPDVEIIEARHPQAWFSMNVRGKVAIVLSYAGRPKRDDGPLSRRDRQRYVYQFSVAVADADWQTPVGANYEAADLAERLAGSPNDADTVPNLRNAPLIKVHDDMVYLRFISETPTIAPTSTPQGGRFALVQIWETFPEVHA
jgi:hypothetical protein